MKNLKYIKSITWNEVFVLWGKEEAQLPHWIEHYKKRGFNSWEEWRKSSVKNLSPELLDWNLFEIVDTGIIPDFYGGPFRAWKKKYYGEKETVQFKELAKNRELQSDQNINEIIKSFPKESVLVGLKKDNKIIIIEGMHRCCALSVVKEKDIQVDTVLYIALAEYNEQLPILGQVNSPA